MKPKSLRNVHIKNVKNMATFMTIFGWVWFVFSLLLIGSSFYLLFLDKKSIENNKRIEELIANTEPDTRVQTNITLSTLNHNILHIGVWLISSLGVFFSSLIIYLYR